jgi:hypothetical protein
MSTAVAEMSRARRSRASILIAAGLRVLVFAITCTGLGMGTGLFLGIIVQVGRSLIHRSAPIDMTVAYRIFGIPLAILCGVGALIAFSVVETRTARRLLANR